MEIALEAAPLDVTGGDDPGSRRGELLEPGVELGVQTMDLRLLRLTFGDVGVGDHVADDPAGAVSTGAAAIETSTSVPSFRWRTVS